jgi:3-methyl-2-oxobutanoate hydroxymethyltransferase
MLLHCRSVSRAAKSAFTVSSHSLHVKAQYLILSS